MARAKAAAACLLTVLFVVFATASAWADFGKRYALVIGNSDYAHVERLPNTGGDAEAIAGALEALRFTVFKGLDLTHDQFDRLIGEFNEAAAEADTVVFYFAGHGFQLNGLNHLAPVDAVLRDRSNIQAETFVLNDIIERIHRRERQTIVFLDACRNNPLPPGVQNGSSQGLAQLETGDGTFIAFATQPGNVSYDGTGRNSPFTEALLTHIGKPGRSISDLMIEVRNDVSSRTLDRQVPWDQSSLRAQFYFNPSPDYIARSEPAQMHGLVISPATPGGSTTRGREAAGEEDLATSPQPQPGAAATSQATPQRVVPSIRFAPAPGQAGAATGPATAAPIRRLEPARQYFVDDAAPSSEDEVASGEDQAEPEQTAATAAPIRRLEPAREFFVDDAAPSSEDEVASGEDPAAPAPEETTAAETAAGDDDAAPTQEQRLAALDPQEQLVPQAREQPQERLLEPEELARRIQTYLTGLGCYRLAIDGDWGPGSRGALEQFYREKGETAPSLEPSMDVLAMVQRETGTVCSAPPAPPAAPQRTRVATPPPQTAPAAPRAQRTQRQRPQQQQQRAPAAQRQPSSPSTPPRIIGF